MPGFELATFGLPDASLPFSDGASFRTVDADANKALVRRFFAEVWHKGRTELAREMVADGYVSHTNSKSRFWGQKAFSER